MRNFSTILLALFFGLFFITACNKDEEPDPSVVGYDYFPLGIGDYRTFEVEKTEYKLTSDTIYDYYVKEIVSDTFEQGGNVVYRLDRYYRDTQDEKWSPDSTWTARRTDDQAIRTEDQTQYLKMVFPLEDGMTWDGNRLNTKDYDEYTLSGPGGKDTVSMLNFDKVATVIQSDYEDLISTDIRKEVYAKGVGLIYKKKIVLSHQDNDTSGVALTEKLIDYGSE